MHDPGPPNEPVHRQGTGCRDGVGLLRGAVFQWGAGKVSKSYGRNNPLSFFDPSGRCAVKAGDSAATDDPGEPCVKQGDTSVTVSAKGGDPDEARIAQFMIWTNVALNTQLREARDIGISTYAGQAIGFGVGKFVVGPVINAVATRIAAQRALAAASGAASGARAGRTWIAAYDVETGAIAVGHSGPVPNASSIHPSLAGKLDQIGGLGAENAGAVGRVGCCGKVDAANQCCKSVASTGVKTRKHPIHRCNSAKDGAGNPKV